MNGEEGSSRCLVVAGSTGGIGSQVVALARARGWRVVTVDRGQYDMRPDEPVGSVAACVFAAGACPVTPLTALSDEKLVETFSVNCGLFVRLVRTLVSRRQYASAGMKVLAVSSVSATEGWAGGAAYCASKGALSAVCRALDVELRPRGITVEAIEPRYVRTRMFDACAGRMGVSADLAEDPRALAARILERVS